MGSTFPPFGYNPITGDWNDSLKGDYFWSSVNVGEASPDVTTPSTWSHLWILYYDVSPIKFPGDHPFIGNICGRQYFNLSLAASIYRSLGMDPRKVDYGDFFGFTREDWDIPLIPFSPWVVAWKSLPGLIKDRMQARRDNRQVKEYVTTIAEVCRTLRSESQRCSDPASLLLLWKESIRPLLVRNFRILRSMNNIRSGLGTQLNRELAVQVGSAEANTLLSNLSGADGNMASLGPLIGLAKVRDGRMTREEYLEQYGHRGPSEAELSIPDLTEDPEGLEKRLADFNRSGIDAQALLTRQRAEFTTAWRRFEARFPGKCSAFYARQERFAEAVKNHEAARSASIRVTRLIRQFLLQAGVITGIGDNIFFLTLDEMADFLAGDRQALSHIPARREVYQRYCALPPYPAIIYGRFDPFQWVADPSRRSDVYDARKSGGEALSSTIKGFAGAVGCVEGTVRRMDCVEDGNQLQPGEILVTTVTNIGWTPLFPRIAAIVTDVGAPLSHAAIVAREIGIPAVVGCGNATLLLKTGDRVRVDGGQGVVEIISK